MALDFPNNPTVNQQFVGSNGVTYVWDGVKWSVLTGSGGGGGGLTVPGGPMVSGNSSTLGSIAVGSNLTLAGTFPNQTLSATGGGSGGGLPLTGGTLYNPGQSDPLRIQADGGVGVGNQTARIVYRALNAHGSGTEHDWAVGASAGGHFEVHDSNLNTNPMTIWAGSSSADPNAGNVYINVGGLVVGTPGVLSATGPGTINATAYYQNGTLFTGSGSGSFLPLTGGTLYNPGNSDPLRIQADGGAGIGNQSARIIYRALNAHGSGTEHDWVVGASPGGHFEFHDSNLNTNPITIWAGSSSADPNAGNLFINVGAALIGNPSQNINILPGPGTLTLNENTGTVLPSAAAGGTTALRLIGRDGQAARISIDTFGGTPNILLRHANGIANAMTATLQGDPLGVLAYIGCTGSTYQGTPSAMIFSYADENWTPSANGARFQFDLVPNGSTGLQAVMNIYGSGDISIIGSNATKPGSTAWANPSDPRLKNHSEPYSGGLSDILELEPIRYRYNGEGPLNGYCGEHVGLDAEAVSKVMPSLIGDQGGYKTVDVSELIFAMINGFKELETRLRQVETKKI